MTDYALLVGINKYPHPNELNGCINDITDVHNVITQTCGFDGKRIELLRDGAATAAAIKSKLSTTVGKLKSGDRFLFHYSGHGAQLKSGNAATDVICPVDFAFTPQTSVTVEDFDSIFSRIPSGVSAVWISDSCHSGDLDRDLYLKGVPKMFRAPSAPCKDSQMPSVRSFRTIANNLPQVALIAGCRSNQTSMDDVFHGRYNGALTHFLLNVLELPGGLRLPLTEVVLRLQAELRTNGYQQVPQLSGPPDEASRTFLQQHPTPDHRRTIREFAEALNLGYEEKGSAVLLHGSGAGGTRGKGTITFRL